MKLIMADLDGTLADTQMVNYLSYAEAAGVYGYQIDFNYFCKHCNGRHYMDFLPQITTSDENVLHEIHKRKNAVYSKYLDKAVLNQPLADLIRLCRPEYKTALVTTASRKNTEEILLHFQIEKLFDLVLTRQEVRKTKPEPEGYLKAMCYFDAKPEECLIFEDSDFGIEAAIRAGCSYMIVKGF